MLSNFAFLLLFFFGIAEASWIEFGCDNHGSFHSDYISSTRKEWDVEKVGENFREETCPLTMIDVNNAALVVLSGCYDENLHLSSVDMETGEIKGNLGVQWAGVSILDTKIGYVAQACCHEASGMSEPYVYAVDSQLQTRTWNLTFGFTRAGVLDGDVVLLGDDIVVTTLVNEWSDSSDSHDWVLVSVSISSNKILWTLPIISTSVESMRMSTDESKYLYFYNLTMDPIPSFDIIKVDGKSGTVLQKYPVGKELIYESFLSKPIILEDLVVVYMGTFDRMSEVQYNDVIAFDKKTSKVSWTIDLTKKPYGVDETYCYQDSLSASIDESSVIISCGDEYGTNPNTFEFDSSSGKLLNKISGKAGARIAHMKDGKVVVFDTNSDFIGVFQNGELVKELDSGTFSDLSVATDSSDCVYYCYPDSDHVKSCHKRCL